MRMPTHGAQSNTIFGHVVTGLAAGCSTGWGPRNVLVSVGICCFLWLRIVRMCVVACWFPFDLCTISFLQHFGRRSIRLHLLEQQIECDFSHNQASPSYLRL